AFPRRAQGRGYAASAAHPHTTPPWEGSRVPSRPPAMRTPHPLPPRGGFRVPKFAPAAGGPPNFQEELSHSLTAPEVIRSAMKSASSSKDSPKNEEISSRSITS